MQAMQKRARVLSGMRWKRQLRGYIVGLLVFCGGAAQAKSQDVDAPVDISQAVVAHFCAELRTAVQGDNRGLVSKWIYLYPIEVERNGKDVLIADDRDFIEKFNVIFDPDMRSILFDPSGCQLKIYPDSTSRIADGQIIIAQSDKDSEPSIEAIAPPHDIELLERIPDRQYERGADNFFGVLKHAVAADDRAAVASMCSYPLRVAIDGKDHSIENRAELLHHYAQVFTPELKKNVLAGRTPMHMGWRGFMTGRGALWLDAIVWTHVYRVTAINGLA